jgi:hypothetical protein
MRHLILFALLGVPAIAQQASNSFDDSIQLARRRAAEAISLEKEGRVLEAQRKYESIPFAFRDHRSHYSAALIIATAYLDETRMRIESASRYKMNIDRETNLNAIFANLAQVERTLYQGMADAPIIGSDYFGQRNLLLARLHFVRGNLDQSPTEIRKSLEMFRNLQKVSTRDRPDLDRIVSYVQGVDRQIRNSPFSHNNLVETAKSLSKLVPRIGAFLPSVIDFVDKLQRSHQTPPRI